ncbi:MAG: hypothetical protein ACRDKZ_00150, partial [Actinomycetota bacterium]
MVAALTGTATRSLTARAERAADAERIIVRLEENARALETFEPVGTYAEGFNPTIAQELRKQMQYIDFLMGESLEELERIDPDFGLRGRRLIDALDAYRGLSLRELRLSIKGRSIEAQAQNDALVAGLKKLEGLLARAAERYRTIASQADRTSSIGSFLMIMLGAVATGTLFWRFERTRRLAVRQKARYQARFSSLVE